MVYVRTLDDVPPQKAFWFCNGTRALNIYQLVDTIKHTNPDVFRYHVPGGSRNDFAAWIREVLEDEVLFNQVRDEIDRHWFIEKVQRRIEELQQ